MLFDTHFHLDLSVDPQQVKALIEQKKIYTIAVTNLPGLYEHTELLCLGTKFIRPALGFHPELIFEHRHQLSLFETLLERTKYVGEVGLDNLRKSPEDFAEQKVVFERILLKCADNGKKVLTIHSRKAEQEVISMIGANFPGKIILHWFSGSIASLKKGVENGCYFSINSAMTRSKSGANVLQNIPLDRLLLESDGPFVDYMGRPADPSVTQFVTSEIATILGVETNLISKQLAKNFKNLIS
jgi:TatD DNase family protein